MDNENKNIVLIADFEIKEGKDKEFVIIKIKYDQSVAIFTFFLIGTVYFSTKNYMITAHGQTNIKKLTIWKKYCSQETFHFLKYPFLMVGL